VSDRHRRLRERSVTARLPLRHHLYRQSICVLICIYLVNIPVGKIIRLVKIPEEFVRIFRGKLNHFHHDILSFKQKYPDSFNWNSNQNYQNIHHAQFCWREHWSSIKADSRYSNATMQRMEKLWNQCFLSSTYSSRACTNSHFLQRIVPLTYHSILKSNRWMPCIFFSYGINRCTVSMTHKWNVKWDPKGFQI